MTTAVQIISSTLSKLGLLQAGQTVQGNDLAVCFRSLNLMLDSWRLSELLAWQDTTTLVTLTSADASKTIGLGQQVNIPLPNRIESSSFVRVGELDYPLRVVDQATFNAIGIKTLPGAWPECVCFERGAATGTLRFWPQGGCVVHLVTRTPFLRFADPTTDYPLAPGYEYAMVYNLGPEIAPDFSVAVPQRIQAEAVRSKRQLKGKRVTVPQLTIGDCGNEAALRAAITGFAR